MMFSALFFRNYISYMLTITVLYLAFPVLIMQSSYNGIYAHFKKTHHFKVLAHSQRKSNPIIVVLKELAFYILLSCRSGSHRSVCFKVSVLH